MNPFMTYQDIIKRGIPCETTPPDEAHTCEYCGKELPYRGVVPPGESVKRFYLASCDCEQACAKRRQAREEEDIIMIKKAEAESREHYMKMLIADSGVKGIYQNATFDSFNATTQEQKKAKMAIMKYAVDFSDFQNNPKEIKKGLFLHGSVGTGKTLLVSALCNDLTRHGIRCVFITVDDMMGKIRETFKSDVSEMSVRNEYKNVPVLILDDLGKEKATDWHTSTLFDIIDSRYSNGLITIVTANHNSETLKELLTPKGSKDGTKADAIISRLIGASREIIPMYWGDYRCIG
ncbi:MAG TPA: ATP-binding protein [Clostridiales bacterium]|nr:ATP-binding protein [Clostridiales bacterium]